MKSPYDLGKERAQIGRASWVVFNNYRREQDKKLRIYVIREGKSLRGGNVRFNGS